MNDPDLTELNDPETPPAAETKDSDPPATETEKPAAPAKIHGHLVPNRHDRRRAAAKARRKGRKK